MPNIEFYAVGEDFDLVLDYVFSRSGCRVFESYSPLGYDLLEFDHPSSIEARYRIGRCAGTGSSALLTLVPPGMMHLCDVRRIALDPKKCDGHTFRYAISGWGLISLHLGGMGPKGQVASYSNHHTAKGAKARQHLYKDDLGSADAWDWETTTKISGALNRFIRNKLALYKLGSRPVMPNAAAAFQRGLGPVEPYYAELLRHTSSGDFSHSGKSGEL
jgi:hypothetical protein